MYKTLPLRIAAVLTLICAVAAGCRAGTEPYSQPAPETAGGGETVARVVSETKRTAITTAETTAEAVKLPEKTDDGRFIFVSFPVRVDVFPDIVPEAYSSDVRELRENAYDEFFMVLWDAYDEWYGYKFDGNTDDIDVLKTHAAVQKETTERIKSTYSNMIKVSGIIEDGSFTESEFDAMVKRVFILFYSNGNLRSYEGNAAGIHVQYRNGTEFLLLNSYHIGAFTFIHEWWHQSGFLNEGMTEYLTHETFSRFPGFSENKGRSPFGGGDNIHSNSSTMPWEYSDRKFQLHEISQTVGLDNLMEALRFTGKFTEEAQLSKIFANGKFIRLIDDNFESFSGELFGPKIEIILNSLYEMPNARRGFSISDGKTKLEFNSYNQASFQNTFTQCLILLVKSERGESVDPGLYEWAVTFMSALEGLDMKNIKTEPLAYGG